MKQHLLHLTKLFLGWPITLIAFFFIYKIISEKTDALSFSFLDINFLLLTTSIFSFFVYFSLRVILWHNILKLQNYHLSFLTTAFYWSSSEIKRFVPGNIWSSISRMQLFSEKEIGKPRFNRGKKEIFLSIIEEAKIVVLSNLIVSAFSFSFSFSIFFPNISTITFVMLAWTLIATIVGFYLYHNPKKYILLLYSIASFICFGLGTYLSIVSVISLSPYYIWTFISFFSFCYVIGYLAFIVPMGLGVRETIMTIGLTKFIAEQTAAIASIYTRIILIISELIFFCFTFFFYKTQESFLKNFISFAQKNIHVLLLILGIFFYILYFSSASFQRFNNFYAGRFDLGNMDQTVWNTTHGRIFQFTDPDGINVISRLAYHADFILILLAPFYFLWSDPRMLLLIQTVILGCGAIFIYLIAQNIFSNKSFGLFFAFMYLLNPYIQHANLYDFHAVTLATTFILAAFYFLQKRHFKFFLFFAILSGLTKENVWLVISLFGAYIFIQAKKNVQKYFFGAAIFAVSFMLFYYLVSIAIPNARGTQHFAISYYSDFGNNPSTIMANILFSPKKTLTIIFQPDRIAYIYQLFLTTGGIAFLSPLYLLFAVPDFAINLLSNNSQLRQIYYQYNAITVPFMLIASIFGTKYIITKVPKIARYIPIYLIVTGLFAAYQFGPLPIAKNPNITMFTTPQKNKESINTFLSSINTNISVAATNNLGSHLSHRQKIFTIPTGINNADMLVFLLNDLHAQPSLAAQKQMVVKLKQDKNYLLIFEKDDFIAFQKK